MSSQKHMTRQDYKNQMQELINNNIKIRNYDAIYLTI